MPKAVLRNHPLFVCALAALGIVVTHLPVAKANSAPPETPAAPSPGAAAANAANHFGQGIFTAVAAAHPTGNVILSPTSLYLALSMADAGAGGATRAAMDRALALTSLPDPSAANTVNAAMLQDLNNPGDDKVTLSIANALWIDHRAKFSEPFTSICRNSYKAEATSLDFANAPAAARTINGWVSQHTQGKIPTIIGPSDLKGGGDAVLTNAVYFHGAWTTHFLASATRDLPFHRPAEAGGDKTVPMMHAVLPASYSHTEAFDAVRLPYGNGRFAFYGILPAETSSATALAPTLTADNWRDLQTRLKSGSGRVDVQLPRFKMDFSADMKNSLSALGMGVAFTNHADFQPMGLPHNHISAVLHKAVLDVNESGTEAAAATAVIISRSAAMRPRPVPRIVFDRPFLCAIIDDQTGAILFEGIVRDPK